MACTPKGTYIQSKYNPLGYLLLTPVFFAAIGINVKLDGVSGGMLAFSVLLLVISVISKLAGCGLGAKLCGFTERESIQVGVGMVCRGEVALIVANRGLSMGVLSSAMMTPVVITVVGGTILTPILLKLVFRGEPQEKLVESRLADRYEKPEQLEDASQQLLDAEAAKEGPFNFKSVIETYEEPPRSCREARPGRFLADDYVVIGQWAAWPRR